MNFPISFYITKYNLTMDAYEELLNDGVFCDSYEFPGGYGTWTRENEYLSFVESYDEWVLQEIFVIEEYGEYYSPRRREKLNEPFRVAGKEYV